MNFYEVLFALKTGTNGFVNHYETLFANALSGGSPSPTLSSITAVFNQGSATIYDTDTLDSLKQYLTVTATYDDSSTATVTAYTLSGTLTVGTSTITVTYQGKTDMFNVTVSSDTEWDANPTLLYDAKTDNVTLSNATMFSETAIGTNGSESLEDGYCRLTLLNATTSTNSRFVISDATATKCKLMAKVRFISIGRNTSTGCGFRMQLSNGTNGVSLYQRYDYNTKNYFVTYSGNTAQLNKLELTLDKWYTIEIERTSTEQIITIDGSVIQSGAYSTYYCTSNRLYLIATNISGGVTPDTIVDIAWVAYYNKD